MEKPQVQSVTCFMGLSGHAGDGKTQVSRVSDVLDRLGLAKHKCSQLH